MNKSDSGNGDEVAARTISRLLAPAYPDRAACGHAVHWNVGHSVHIQAPFEPSSDDEEAFDLNVEYTANEGFDAFAGDEPQPAESLGSSDDQQKRRFRTLRRMLIRIGAVALPPRPKLKVESFASREEGGVRIRGVERHGG